MKKLSFILISLLFTATTYAATITIHEEAKDWNIPAEAIDVLQARAICAGLASGETTGTKYYVIIPKGTFQTDDGEELAKKSVYFTTAGSSDDEDEDDEFEDCIGCPYFCEECGTCTYDE